MMRFSVDPWDPAYGTSVDTELGDSTAEVDVDVELPGAPVAAARPAGRGRPAGGGAVRGRGAPGRRPDLGGRAGRHRVARAVRVLRGRGGLLLPADGAHLVDAGCGGGCSPRPRPAPTSSPRPAATLATQASALPGRPPMQPCRWPCSAAWPPPSCARRGRRRGPRQRAASSSDGPLPPQPLPPARSASSRSHRDPYLPAGLRRHRGHPRGRASAPRCSGSADRAAGSWERCTWYLRLPAAPGAPWAGVVRVECGPDLEPSRGGGAGRRQPGDAAPVRLRRLQGPAGAAEPLPDRRAGTGASTPAGRADRAATGRCAGPPPRPDQPASTGAVAGRAVLGQQRGRHPAQQHRVGAAGQQVGLLDAGRVVGRAGPMPAAQLRGWDRAGLGQAGRAPRSRARPGSAGRPAGRRCARRPAARSARIRRGA